MIKIQINGIVVPLQGRHAPEKTNGYVFVKDAVDGNSLLAPRGSQAQRDAMELIKTYRNHPYWIIKACPECDGDCAVTYYSYSKREEVTQICGVCYGYGIRPLEAA